MSGITGIFRRDGRDVDPADIKKMNDKISHRGPDGSWVWFEGPVAFGHQMLHTTQESLHEILPFEDEESGLVITADARIDNRKDLAPLLGIENNEYVSDSYFILKAYEKWGEKCPEELLGDFTFAIWDKNKEQLFCARDHMGVKPFYYHLSDEIFIFATEIKSIFIISNNFNVNDVKMAYFLTNNTKDKSSTFFEKINRLIPANSVLIDENYTKIEKYWKLDSRLKIHLDSEEEYVESFIKIFKESIQCRLRSFYPLGFELSGGLDSSSIVAMANSIKNDKVIKTFSYVFEDLKDCDESYYINKVLEIDDMQSFFVKIDNISFFDEMESILSYEDQPYPNPYQQILWHLYEKMQDENVRILLSGAGGDNVISRGNNYFLELTVTFQWFKLFLEMRNYSKIMDLSFNIVFMSNVIYPLIPSYIKSFFCSLGVTSSSKNFIKSEFFNEIKNREIYCEDNYTEFLSKSKKVKEHHYISLNLNTHQTILEMVNHISAAFLIEPRYPYFDKRLIEFCYAIPTEMKFRTWNRYIQRISMNNLLPPEVQWRTDKSYLNLLLFKNLSKDNKKLKMLFSDINNNPLKRYIDLNSLEDVYSSYKKNKETGYPELYYLSVVMIMYLWFKKE